MSIMSVFYFTFIREIKLLLYYIIIEIIINNNKK